MSLTQIVVYDLDNTCQCCFTKETSAGDGNTEMLIHGDSYFKLLEDCFTDKIFFSPNLSTYFTICPACIDKVNECVKFKKLIQETQERLFSAENVQYFGVPVNADGDVDGTQPLQQEYLEFEPEIAETKSLKKRSYDDGDDSCDEYQNNEEYFGDDPDTMPELKLKESLIRKLSLQRCKNKPKRPRITPENKQTPEPKKNVNKYEKPFILKKTDLICPVCSEVFLCHTILVRHMRIHYPEFICNVCGKTFVTRFSYHSHLSVHLGPIPCTQCDKILSSKSSLRTHMQRTHLGRRDFHPCSMCDLRFDNARIRTEHMEKVHNVSEKYTCKICNKDFNMYLRYRTHMYVHNPLKKGGLLGQIFICDICDKSFPTLLQLRAHIATHDDTRQFKCHICPSVYKVKSLLTRHLRMHDEGSEKFVCELCSSMFPVRYLLKVHMRKAHKKIININSLKATIFSKEAVSDQTSSTPASQ